MAVLQIRLEESLKNDVSALFDRLGMDIPTAVRIFFKRAATWRTGYRSRSRVHRTPRTEPHSWPPCARQTKSRVRTASWA